MDVEWLEKNGQELSLTGRPGVNQTQGCRQPSKAGLHGFMTKFMPSTDSICVNYDEHKIFATGQPNV